MLPSSLSLSLSLTCTLTFLLRQSTQTSFKRPWEKPACQVCVRDNTDIERPAKQSLISYSSSLTTQHNNKTSKTRRSRQVSQTTFSTLPEANFVSAWSLPLLSSDVFIFSKLLFLKVYFFAAVRRLTWPGQSAPITFDTVVSLCFFFYLGNLLFTLH